MTTDGRRVLPAWATEATLGIFVHWGAYSVPGWAVPSGVSGAVPEEHWFSHNAYAEWYANTIRIEGSPAALHHARKFGGAPYDRFLDDWHAEDFDPADWARLFRRAGADYVIPVTKHHDGIVLWDAPGADDRSTLARGPRRDLIGPLSVSVRAEGMRFGVYYSGGLDWAVTDLPAQRTFADVTRIRPNDEAYAAYATLHVRDLIHRYRPSVLWNDIEWPDAGKADGSLHDLISYYRATVPDGIVNDRWGIDVFDFRTSEYAHDAAHETGTGWEHNRGLGFSYGYNRKEGVSSTLSVHELARLYVDIVSRGGRLLLNVGPEASGSIPAVQRRTLEDFGVWMQRVKPLTAERGQLAPETLAVTVDGTDSPWWRAWLSGDRIVVITESERALVRTRDAREVSILALPQV